MADRVSQETVEVLEQAAAKSRLSQEAVEVLEQGPAQSRVSQETVEVVARYNLSGDRVSQVAVEVLTTPPSVDPSFISSVTTLYALSLVAQEALPFIASVTVVDPPTLAGASTEVDVPFIASETRVYGVMSLFGDMTYLGPGNGGEIFPVRLNASGASDIATLAADIGATDTALTLTGDSSFPSVPFVATVDDEVLYLTQISPGSYRIRGRSVSNTLAAAHTAGATVTWGDSYDLAVLATDAIDSDFTADVNDSGSETYRGWLICFDSSQGYLSGARYPMHVAQMLGVFAAGTGSSGTNLCDAAQPNAISTPVGVSDDCPIGLSNPSRIQAAISAGDVALVRYTNPESVVLDLGPRSVGIQSWYGLARYTVESGTPVDVTLTDVNGVVVDTIGDDDSTFTSAVITEPGEPLPLAIGIAPDPSDALGYPVSTPNEVPWLTVTETADLRDYTVPVADGGQGLHGVPIGALAVRQGNRRVPYWVSWDWTDYTYSFCGWGTDCTYVQNLVELNGILHALSQFEYPNNDDANGPDAIWDDATYYFSACWYVCLLGSAITYVVAGAGIGGRIPPGGGGIPVWISPGGPISYSPPSQIIVGGSGGGEIGSGVIRSLFQAAAV